MVKDFLTALYTRRVAVEKEGLTWENSPARCRADSSAILKDVPLTALPATVWLQHLASTIEQELPSALENRGVQPQHAPCGPTSDEVESLQMLAALLQEQKRRLEVERQALRDDAKALLDRTTRIESLEEEVVAERTRLQRKNEFRQNYPRPLWLHSIEHTFNIGVVGNSGVGKSLLINKVRRLHTDDRDWALVGVHETTMVPTPYSLPHDSRIKLWDLPGSGTPSFPSETYIQTVGLCYFDRVVIVSAGRFTSAEIELRAELEAKCVPHFMVRTKADIDLWNNEKDNQLEPAETLAQIRENLVQRGIPRVYILSSREPDKYDFPEFQEDVLAGLDQKDGLGDPKINEAGWAEPWALPEAYSPALSGLQGHWDGPDDLCLIVQGLRVHVTTSGGCAEMALREEADGKIWWMSQWWVDKIAVANCYEDKKTCELRWTSTDSQQKPMIWNRVVIF